MHIWSTVQKSIARQAKLTQLRPQPNRKNSKWNNVSVTHVISNSHRRLVKTACRPPVVQCNLRNAFSLFTPPFFPPSFLFLPFSQNNSSFVAPLCCASSRRHSSLRGVWFNLLLFGVVKYTVIPVRLDMKATFFLPLFPFPNEFAYWYDQINRQRL